MHLMKRLAGKGRDEQAPEAGGHVPEASQGHVVRLDPRGSDERVFTVLVIDSNAKGATDWTRFFQGLKVHGKYGIRVEQGPWSDLVSPSWSRWL